MKSGRSALKTMPASMKPREPVPVLCAILVPSGSCEGSRALSFCQERMSSPSRQSAGVTPMRAATAGSVVPRRISSSSMP